MPVAIAAILLVAGCGLAADFAAPAPTPICEGAGCQAETPAQITEAVVASPVTANAATPQAPNLPPASPAAPAIAPEPPASPVGFASAAAVLGPVIWTADIDPETRAPRSPAAALTTDVQIIYATVAVERVSAGTEFGAVWTYNRTRLESFDGIIVAEATEKNVWIEFHLALRQPGTWPNGVYEVAISVNGQPAVAGRIEIDDPEV